LALAAGAWHPLPAQSRALVVFGFGGRHAPVVNLTDTGDDYSAAFSYGGGVAVQFGPRIALRASISRHRARYRGETVALSDSGATRYAYGGDLQVGWPSTSPLVPYVFLGAGAVRSDPDEMGLATTTSPAGRFGVGINRVSRIGAWFLEFGAWLYQFDGLGLKRFQFDVEGRLGFAMAIGL
jgi:hypothetical protein